MKAYQGEPIVFRLNIKDNDGTYLPSLEGISLEAIVTKPCGDIVKGWSTEEGTMTIGVEEIEGVERGYASFLMSGSETSTMGKGIYGFELARVYEDGRAIGVVEDVIEILCARIKNGI